MPDQFTTTEVVKSHDSGGAGTSKPRMIRKPKPPSTAAPRQYKPPEFTIRPIPGDLTKGMLDKQGVFRWRDANACMEWFHEVTDNPINQIKAYVYRLKPLCVYSQSSGENPEPGNNISIWESWPFANDDHHSGMLNENGGGTYMILFKDNSINRIIAKLEAWEFPITTSYPPHIRVDDVVIDSNANKSFIAWARQNGVNFPHDNGHEPGQYVHKAVKSRGDSDNDMSSPITQRVNEALGNMAAKAIEERFSPGAAAPLEEKEVVKETVREKADMMAFEVMKMGTEHAIKQNERDNSNMLDLVKIIVKQQEVAKATPVPGNDSALETMKFMMETMREEKREALKRLERMEERAFAVPPPPAQKSPLEALVEMKHLMSELGYAPQNGRGRVEESTPAPTSLVDQLIEKLPDLFQSATQMWSAHLNAQVQMAQLQARMAQGAPGGQQQGQVQQDQAQQIPPQQQQQRPQSPPQPAPGTPGAQRATANEAVRGALAPEFDMIVEAFHPELDRLYRVVNSKFVAGIHAIASEKADAVERLDIMADQGCELALWYTQWPDDRGMIGDAHQGWKTMFDNKPYIIKGLMSYKPIWDVVGQAPPELIGAFIDGFCDLHRLDEDEESDQSPGDEDDKPTVIEMAKVN